MRQSLPMIAAVSGCLLLFSAGVQPRIATGSASPELTRTLATETHRRLAAEFLEQRVAFELAGTRVWPGDGGQWRVRAEGTADFGAEGQATATIDALYDPQAGRWLQLDYQLL